MRSPVNLVRFYVEGSHRRLRHRAKGASGGYGMVVARVRGVRRARVRTRGYYRACADQDTTGIAIPENGHVPGHCPGMRHFVRAAKLKRRWHSNCSLGKRLRAARYHEMDNERVRRPAGKLIAMAAVLANGEYALRR